MLKSSLRILSALTCVAVITAACNSPVPNSLAASDDSSSENCPYISAGDVTAVWVRPVSVNFFQLKYGGNHCEFSATDTKTKDVLEVIVQTNDSADDARIAMQAFGGIKGTVPWTGIGDESNLNKDVLSVEGLHGIDLTFRKDKYVAIITLTPGTEANTPIVEKIARIVLAKFGKS